MRSDVSGALAKETYMHTHTSARSHVPRILNLTSHVLAKLLPDGGELDAVAAPGVVELHHPRVLCAVDRGRKVAVVQYHYVVRGIIK